uniref:Uncharacterized protein n=1 Tax=Rhizophora mucronata TaxID=61149 RepID=A0A2P2P8Z5_RHIMU
MSCQHNNMTGAPFCPLCIPNVNLPHSVHCLVGCLAKAVKNRRLSAVCHEFN